MENKEIRDESKAAANPILGQTNESIQAGELQSSQSKQGNPKKAHSYEL